MGGVLLVVAGIFAYWVLRGSLSGNLPGAESDGSEPAGFGPCVHLGVYSFVVLILAGVTMLCTAKPLRRGRPDFARIAAGEILIAGLLVSAVVLAYWLWWSPMSFLN